MVHLERKPSFNLQKAEPEEPPSIFDQCESLIADDFANEALRATQDSCNYIKTDQGRDSSTIEQGLDPVAREFYAYQRQLSDQNENIIGVKICLESIVKEVDCI